MLDLSAGSDGAGSGRRGPIALYLALYLLILTFFILLVSISTFEEVKSRAVMDSLSVEFTSLLPPSDTSRFTVKDEDIIAGEQFQEQVGSLFTAALRVAKVEVVQPGRLMHVALPADSLFHVDEARLREAHFPLLDRIVAAVSGRPPGLRYELEFIIGTRYVVGRDMPIGQTLEMARGGAFARGMVSRGVPPDSISIGLEPGNPDDVTIRFLVRALDQARLRLKAPDEDKQSKQQESNTKSTAHGQQTKGDPATTGVSPPSSPVPAAGPGNGASP